MVQTLETKQKGLCVSGQVLRGVVQGSPDDVTWGSPKVRGGRGYILEPDPDAGFVAHDQAAGYCLQRCR